MSILSVVKLEPSNYECKGNCLRTVSREVSTEEIKSPWFRTFVSDMFETLYSNSSGVGLAANQVAVLLRVCVVDLKRDAKNPLVLINPSYKPIGEGKHLSNEVCLSFPGVVSEVERYDVVEVTYQSVSGSLETITAEGFKSDVFQHEIDHLNGLVQVDRIANGKTPEPYAGYNHRMALKATDKLWETENV